MNKFELGWGWKRDFMGDVPELVAEEREDGTCPTTPQQIGFITPENAKITLSYDQALRYGLITEEEEQWSMSITEYLEGADL